MYTLENIIRSATRQQGDSLNVLCLNEGYDEYLTRLAEAYDKHNFYLVHNISPVPQWTKETKPKNIHVCVSVHETPRYFDFVLVFNRAGMYEQAEKLTMLAHLPMVVVDFTTSHNKVPHPFFSEVNINNPDVLFHRNGDINVSVSEDVGQSWNTPLRKISATIPLPVKEFVQTNAVKNKILIDSSLPPQYTDQLPINLNNTSIFTTLPSEAYCYLHLWKNMNLMFADCLASEIPVVTMQSPDFRQVINSQACVLIEDLSTIQNENFYTNFINFSSLPKIVENAKNIVKEHSLEQFKKQWENIFIYLNNSFYNRI